MAAIAGCADTGTEMVVTLLRASRFLPFTEFEK